MYGREEKEGVREFPSKEKVRAGPLDNVDTFDTVDTFYGDIIRLQLQIKYFQKVC